MAVKGSVPTPGVIVPHLVVRDAAEAVSFYAQAFRAEVLYRSPSPTGAGRTHTPQDMGFARAGLDGGACSAK
jgi:uncharacterized glyoxalase superfamily protein PhnB